MDRYPKRIFVRVSEEEHDQAMQLASSLGLTCSELVRLLIKMPKDFIGDEAGNTIVVIDKDSVRQLTRETLDAPEMDGPGPLPGYEPFDWSAVMDKTRHDARNDLPWRGKRVRTYKHYVVSPDP